MAIDEIEALGESLLQRQRTTRKRKQRRIDKDQRNALWLNVAGVGVGLANNYLRERATNFINNNEEIQGQRLLFQKSLKNKERIITEYGQAQQHATGVEGWLAENKFAPIIKANIERTFSTRGYSKKDIENMVLDRAKVEAAKYRNSYEKSYEEALKMGTIEDFDSYIRSKDGHAENVGGFLFNQISRSLNDTTQEDIDQEMIQSIRNNRFGKNALQLAYFDNQVSAGARVQDAKDLAYKGGSDTGFTNRGTVPERYTLEDYGVGRAVPILKSVEPHSLNFSLYGRDQTVHLNKFTYEDETGELMDIIYGPMTIRLANKETVIQDPEMFDLWANQQGPDIFIDPNLRVENNSEYMEAQLASRNWRIEVVPDKTDEFTGQGPYNRSGTTRTFNIVDRRGNIVNSIERTTYVTDLTPSTKAQRIDPELVSIMIPQIELALEHTRIPGESETLGSKEAFALYLYGNRDRLDDALDQNVDLSGKISRGMDVFAREAAVRAQDIMEEYPDLDFNQASKLAAKGAIVPLAYSYNDDEESVLHQDNFFDFNRSPAINMLLAESMLSTGSRGAGGIDTNWEGVSERTMVTMATAAFNELKNLEDGTAEETNYYKENAAERLRQVKGFEEIVVPATIFDIETPEANELNPLDLIVAAQVFPSNWEEYQRVRGDADAEGVDPGYFTFEQLINVATGEPPARTDEVIVDDDDSAGIDLSIIEGYERPPEISPRVQRQLDEAARFQTPQEETVVGATAGQIRRVQERNDSAARDIKEILSQNKLPVKDIGIARAKINAALLSDLLTDEEKEILNTWLGKDSPK